MIKNGCKKKVSIYTIKNIFKNYLNVRFFRFFSDFFYWKPFIFRCFEQFPSINSKHTLYNLEKIEFRNKREIKKKNPRNEKLHFVSREIKFMQKLITSLCCIN